MMTAATDKEAESFTTKIKHRTLITIKKPETL